MFLISNLRQKARTLPPRLGESLGWGKACVLVLTQEAYALVLTHFTLPGLPKNIKAPPGTACQVLGAWSRWGRKCS